jgi:SSS family solute:Na+ symporter
MRATVCTFTTGCQARAPADAGGRAHHERDTPVETEQPCKVGHPGYYKTVNLQLAWILAYSALLIGLGAFLARRVRKSEDFLVAGRKLGPGLVFATFLAANIGAGSTVGAAALGYSLGWSAWWWVGSAGIGCLVLGNTVGPRIWYWARAEGFHTLGDYLEYRYSRSVRGAVALILWPGTAVLLAAQLVAISVILHAVAGIPRWQGSLLGGLVVVAYFAAGGLLSSAWINLLELVVLLAGFVLALPFALDAAGGWGAVVRSIDMRPQASASGFFSPVGFGAAGALYHLALLAPSFIVSPGLVQKIYGARSAAAARAGVNWNALGLLLFAALPPCLGIVAAARFPGLADAQLALPKVILELLPAWLGTLVLAAVFSAEISTCDAVLFMLSTSLTIDLYRTFVNPRASERELLGASRLSAVVGGACGTAVALGAPTVIGALTVFYALVSVALFVPVVAGLYSRRPDARAALAAIAVSVPLTVALHLGWGERVIGILSPTVLGIAASFTVLWGVTATRRRREA